MSSLLLLLCAGAGAYVWIVCLEFPRGPVSSETGSPDIQIVLELLLRLSITVNSPSAGLHLLGVLNSERNQIARTVADS